MLTIIGLGTRADDVSVRGLRTLETAERIFLRTEKTCVTATLTARNLAYTALDSLYETCEDYDELSRAIALAVLSAKETNVAYAVPGGATLGDSTVAALIALCKERDIEHEVIPAASWENYAAAAAGGIDHALVFPAGDFAQLRPDPHLWLLVIELDNREVAGELKLRLLDHYPAEHAVLFQGQILPLHELDRQRDYAYDATLAVPPVQLADLDRFSFDHLCEIVARLRDPIDGCPWDKVQTHESLRPYVIEEAYEAADAIDSGDPARLADELGDVLLQVALHAQIADEHGNFDVNEITTAVCRKMISRHSHLFGGDTAATVADVRAL
jgi:tetrapyrrole methylase family protein/MazG family protein